MFKSFSQLQLTVCPRAETHLYVVRPRGLNLWYSSRPNVQRPDELDHSQLATFWTFSLIRIRILGFLEAPETGILREKNVDGLSIRTLEVHVALNISPQ